MRALRKVAPEKGLALEENICLSDRAGDSVLIHIEAVGICGSDLHAYEWTRGYEFMTPLMPVTLGHEFAGTVKSVPEGQSVISVGQRVTIWPTKPCQKCAACRNGEQAFCDNRSIIGLHCDGGFAEQVSVPLSNCFPLPTDLPPQIGALTEPLSISIHAVKTADVKSGQNVLIFGPGPIGLFCALYAKSLGANVLLAGFNDTSRLSLAREMGITHITDSAETDIAEAVRNNLNGKVDCVIEAAGVSSCLEDGLRLLRPGGIMAIAGIHATNFSLDVTPFVRRKQQIRACHDTTRESFEEAIRFLADHKDTMQKAISHCFKLEDFAAAFETALKKQSMKVLLQP